MRDNGCRKLAGLHGWQLASLPTADFGSTTTAHGQNDTYPDYHSFAAGARKPLHAGYLGIKGMGIRDFRMELKIRSLLRKVSRQRVALVLQPGNVWVIEKAVEGNEETDSVLKTCYMRGWLEPLENTISIGKLTAQGKLPEGKIFDHTGPVYRLTECGWSVINRSHQWVVLSAIVAFLAVLVGLLTLLVTRH